MNVKQAIEKLNDLKDHCRAVGKIENSNRYAEYIRAIDTVVEAAEREIENIHDNPKLLKVRK